MRLLALSPLVFALPPFHSGIRPLAPAERAQLTGEFWRAGCPVALANLRILTVSHWDFGGGTQTGALVVNSRAAAPLARVFGKLYRLHFPIRHMQLGDYYGPRGGRPRDGDVSESFECRKAVPSPCGAGTGNWSNHAYGLAVDLNPIENPYTGCGRTRERASRPYLKRSRLRAGMVTPAVVRAFRAIGWGWGGSWSGSTKDYMHFSWNGH